MQPLASLSSFLRGGFSVLLFSLVYRTRALVCALSGGGWESFLRRLCRAPDTLLSLATPVASSPMIWVVVGTSGAEDSEKRALARTLLCETQEERTARVKLRGF